MPNKKVVAWIIAGYASLLVFAVALGVVAMSSTADLLTASARFAPWLLAGLIAAICASGLAVLYGFAAIAPGGPQTAHHNRLLVEKARLLFDFASDGLWILDMDGRIVDLNRISHERLGYAAEEMLGKLVTQFSASKFSVVFPEIAALILRQGHAVFENTQIRKDGSLLPVEVNSRYIELDGRPHFFSIVRDISRRKAAQDALLLSEETSRALLNAISESAMLIQPDGMVLAVNETGAMRLGKRPYEIVGRNTFDMLPADVAANRRKYVAEVISGKLPVRFRDQRSGRDLEQILFPIFDITGNVCKIAIYANDITERIKQTENERQFALHIAAQTAASIAHDINQPLNSIELCSAIALQQLGKGEAELLAQTLEQISGLTRRAGLVTRELLQFLQRGRHAPPLPVALNQVVFDALNAVKSASSLPFRLATDWAQDLPMVLCHAPDLHRVATNLLRNSLDACHHAGIIEPLITVRTAAQGDMAQVTIMDNGPGLGPDAMQHLFEPFFTTKDTGVGMGLATSRALIEAQGGKLWYEAGTGATFHFTLPFSP